jgi:hypothetical protein
MDRWPYRLTILECVDFLRRFAQGNVDGRLDRDHLGVKSLLLVHLPELSDALSDRSDHQRLHVIIHNTPYCSSTGYFNGLSKHLQIESALH